MGTSYTHSDEPQFYKLGVTDYNVCSKVTSIGTWWSCAIPDISLPVPHDSFHLYKEQLLEGKMPNGPFLSKKSRKSVRNLILSNLINVKLRNMESGLTKIYMDECAI